MAWTTNDIPAQRGRVAVVTGANSGLGLEIARELARKDGQVVMAVRDPGKGDQAAEDIRADAPDAVLEVRQLDLASLESVTRFADSLRADHPALDILVNNAGVMASPARETADGFESQVGINHLAHFALTRALLPSLTAASAARVVTMTSFGRLTGRPLRRELTRLDERRYDPWRAYGDSKLANYHFALELARRLDAKESRIASLVAHPGLAHTGLQRRTVSEAGAGVQGRFWAIAARWFGVPPERAALPALRAATDPDARNGDFYGPRWFAFGSPVRLRVRDRSARPDDTASMWVVSEEATGVTFDVARSGRETMASSG